MIEYKLCIKKGENVGSIELTDPIHEKYIIHSIVSDFTLIKEVKIENNELKVKLYVETDEDYKFTINLLEIEENEINENVEGDT